MTTPARDDVIGMLARFRDRPPEAVTDRLDSLELAWLLQQVDERYGVRLDLDDDRLARMTTVDRAVEVLAEAVPAARRVPGRGAPPGEAPHG